MNIFNHSIGNAVNETAQRNRRKRRDLVDTNVANKQIDEDDGDSRYSPLTSSDKMYESGESPTSYDSKK